MVDRFESLRRIENMAAMNRWHLIELHSLALQSSICDNKLHESTRQGVHHQPYRPNSWKGSLDPVRMNPRVTLSLSHTLNAARSPVNVELLKLRY